MKSDATRKRLLATPAEWKAVIAAAPGKARPLTHTEAVKMTNAVVVKRGGYAAVRAALLDMRRIRIRAQFCCMLPMRQHSCC